MTKTGKAVRLLVLMLPWMVGRPSAAPAKPPEGAAAKTLLAGGANPRAYGVQDSTISVISATSFRTNSFSCGVEGPTLSQLCPAEGYPRHSYATLNLPAGAVIDYIGVNTASGVDAGMGFTLHFRDHLGGTAQLVSVSFPAHGFQTDYMGPLGILIPAHIDRVFVLDVEVAPAVEGRFGFVEVWWRRTVSDPPATPTFGDVPGSHPFYAFIEALAKSGVTGGCGGGNYCPESPLTRGQMAVFLSKALGLHWPY
jgi:hypothetical protein